MAYRRNNGNVNKNKNEPEPNVKVNHGAKAQNTFSLKNTVPFIKKSDSS